MDANSTRGSPAAALIQAGHCDGGSCAFAVRQILFHQRSDYKAGDNGHAGVRQPRDDGYGAGQRRTGTPEDGRPDHADHGKRESEITMHPDWLPRWSFLGHLVIRMLMLILSGAGREFGEVVKLGVIPRVAAGKLWSG